MEPALDKTFTALADPTRRAILARLAGGEATVSQIVEGFSLTQPTISSHLKVLEAAGLIIKGRAANTRPCRLNPAAFRQLDDWIGFYRAHWGDAFARLDGYLDDIQKGDTE